MSVAEKTERNPGSGDKENGESGEKSKSENFLDPMKVFIFSKVGGYSSAPCSALNGPLVISASQIFLPFFPWYFLASGPWS